MKQFLFLMFSVVCISVINAGTIIVQNTNDSGTGSLRQATIDALDGDTIRFNPNLIANGSDTITLVSRIDFDKGLVIKGLFSPSDTLFISGQDPVCILSINLDTANNKNMIIDSLVLTNGRGGIRFYKGDSLEIINSIIKNCSSSNDGGGVYFYEKGVLIISNSKITNNSTINSGDDGGGVYFGGQGSLVISSSKIEYNRCLRQGGGLYCGLRSNVLISNSIIGHNKTLSNSSFSNGGGIYLGSIVNLTLESSTIEFNESYNSGGGIFGNTSDQNNENLIVNNSIIRDNISANGQGGGIFTAGINVLINNSKVLRNIGGYSGGGIAIHGSYSHVPSQTAPTAQFNNSDVNYNISNYIGGGSREYGGGGVIAIDTKLLINNTNIDNNKSNDSNGGGICYITGSSLPRMDSLVIKKSNIIGNSSNSSGGGVSCKSMRSITIENSNISNNIALRNGGGLVFGRSMGIYEMSYSKVYNSTFDNNKSSLNGGAILGFRFNIQKTTFNKNSSVDGGGIYGSKYIIKSSTFTKNTSSNNGGAIHSTNDEDYNKDSLGLIITNSTFTQNSALLYGGGIYSNTTGVGSGSNIRLKSSIVALNSSSNTYGVYNNVAPTIISGGYNIFSEAPLGYSLSTDQVNIDSASINLLPLAFNGGTTQTLLPGVGSVAIDMGNLNDNSDAQNGSFFGRRDVGAAESCIYSVYDTITSCYSYSFGSNVYSTSGTYYDSLINVNGCDSIRTLFLTIEQRFQDTLPLLLVCAADSALVFNEFESLNGVYYDSLVSVNGCDSVWVQEVIFGTVYKDTLPKVTICSNDSALVFGSYKTASGIYYDSLLTISGCDSIIIQELLVNNMIIDTIPKIGICRNDSALIFGNYETISGIYYDSLLTIKGCDSIIMQELIVNQFYQDTLNSITICSNDSILIFGGYKSSQGIYVDSSLTINGCDSIIVQELKINLSYIEVLTPLIICEDDSILIFGSYKSLQGMYYDSLLTINGCDSVIEQELIVSLNLTYTQTPIVSCDSVLVDGIWYTHSKVVIDSLQTLTGCDSIIVKAIIINSPEIYYQSVIEGCDSVFFMGEYYYSDTTVQNTYISGNLNSCDSITVQDLIVHPIDLTTTQTDLTLTANQLFASYQWIDCNNGNIDIVGEENRSYTVTSNGDYAVIVTTANCSDTSDCISINDVGINNNYDGNIRVFPNPNTGIFTIDFSGSLSLNSEVNIFNVIGEKVKQINPTNKLEQINLSGFENGVYFVNVVNESINKVIRIIKQ